MGNLIERIKRTGLLVRYYQTLHPDNSTCGCCGLPWAVVKPHSIDMVECTNEHSGQGFFPVCEWCWQNKPYIEIVNAVINLHEFWAINGRLEGYEPPYTLQEMLKKTREDYEKAQKEAHCKAMEE